MANASPSLTRLRWTRRVRSLVALMLLSALAVAAWVWLPVPAVIVPLAAVTDGDSLTVRQDGTALSIRLSGIDAVEYRQDCARDAGRWPCGREARSTLEKLVGLGPLHCDLSAKDRYARTLAACRTRPFPDGSDLGAEMVRLGWAVATSDAYMVEEAEAQAQRRGIWEGDFVRPAEWRAAQGRPATALAAPDS